MKFQSLIWRFRWRFDRKWKESTLARYRRDQHKRKVALENLRDKGTEQASSPPTLRMTALRRFVLDRL